MYGSKNQYHVRNKLLITDPGDTKFQTREMRPKRRLALEKLERILSLPQVIVDEKTHGEIKRILDVFLHEPERYDYRLTREEVELAPLDVAARFDRMEVGTLLELMKQPSTRLHNYFGGKMPPLIQALHTGWQETAVPPADSQQSWSSIVAK